MLKLTFGCRIAEHINQYEPASENFYKYAA
jgi:hypothetical protein